MTTTRRLAAILAADVAGYSAAMERDEEGTAAAVRALRREVIEPNLAEHQGRLIKTTGDGFLAEFASPIAALNCALAIQQRPDAGGLQLRIGLNLGDVIIEEGGDLLGEGVNVAARLESLAEPGGILISDKILREVEGKVQAAFEDRGDQQVKNITRPVRAYAVMTATASTRLSTTFINTKPLPLPDKPSIAVLPFQNMSGNPEQDYFADGMVEDIITALSRFKSLFVIARNSSFTYKGKAVDIKQVGRDLGVRYVLEGSVRKSGGRVRITGQLIDAANGTHLWADKFEGAQQEIFDLQDSVTESVVGAIAPRLIQADVERTKRRPPENWASYDFYLQGLAAFLQRTPDGVKQALALFRRAIELDPEFGPAHVRAASCFFMKPQYFGEPLSPAERSEALSLARRALALASDDELVLAWGALVLSFMNDEVERASDLVDRALALNSNFSNAWNARGWISLTLGEHERAADAFDHGMRFNPFDDWTVFIALQGKCSALLQLGRRQEGLEVASRLLARRPEDLRSNLLRCMLEADPSQAAEAISKVRALFPNLRTRDLRELFVIGLRKPESRDAMEATVVRLGFPE
jgi:adenylate cyclase